MLVIIDSYCKESKSSCLDFYNKCDNELRYIFTDIKVCHEFVTAP